MIDDLVVMLGMALLALAFGLRSIVRSFRRMVEARPGRVLHSSPVGPEERRVPVRVPRTVDRPSPPLRPAAPIPRQPSPSLDARLFGNRRLSLGARLIIASEILCRPKGFRRKA
jgi:hypothetical protein